MLCIDGDLIERTSVEHVAIGLVEQTLRNRPRVLLRFCRMPRSILGDRLEFHGLFVFIQDMPVGYVLRSKRHL